MSGGFHAGGDDCCGFHLGGTCNPSSGSGLSIGGAVTGGTAGRVLYEGAGPVLADDAPFTWDETNNQLSVGAGALALPALVFGDTTTGLFRPAADQLAVAFAAALGIAMGAGTAPVMTLPDSDVRFAVGRAVIDARTADQLQLSHRDMTNAGQESLKQTATGRTDLNAASGQPLNLGTAGTPRWSLDATTGAWKPIADNSRNLGDTALRIVNSFWSGYMEISEMTAPAAPGSDKARLFVRDNGSAKSQLCVIFPTGAIQVIATEP